MNVHEFDELSQPYSDSNLSVTPVIVLPTSSKKRNFDQVSSEDSLESGSSESDTESSSPKLIERFKKNTAGATGSEAQAYRQKVISLMFTDASKGEKAPGHTIEAECSPRSQKTAHPLSSEEKGASNQRGYLMQMLPGTKPHPAAISYICQGTPVPRKFNKSAAMALGIKPGPIYGQLQRGNSVTLDDGRVITQDMVCDPEVPGHVFMVVDCPGPAYIDNLVRSDKFNSFKQGGSHKVNVMIHFAGLDVLRDKRYQDWLNSFDASTDVSCINTRIKSQGSNERV